MINSLLVILKGALLGIAFVIPGFSGGTMAVILKIYDKLIDIVSLNLKKIKENLKANIIFTALLAVGAIIGVLATSFGLSALFEHFPVPTGCFFAGVVIGSLKPLWKECAGKEKFRRINIIPLVAAAAFMVGMFIVDITLNGGSDTVQTSLTPVLAVKMFFGGIVAAVAMVVPGVSGSLMMTIMGLYQTLITAIKDFNIPILIFAGIGILVGLVGGARIIALLFKKARQATYAAIIGLIAGSVLSVFPFSSFALDMQGIIGIILIPVGIALPILCDRLSPEGE